MTASNLRYKLVGFLPKLSLLELLLLLVQKELRIALFRLAHTVIIIVANDSHISQQGSSHFNSQPYILRTFLPNAKEAFLQHQGLKVLAGACGVSETVSN